MAYRVWSVSTKTWADKVLVEPSSCTWGTALNEGKPWRAEFQLGDPGIAASSKAGHLAPLSRALIVEWEGVPLYGGIITTSSYDRDTQKLTLSHDDAMWWVLARRFVLADRSNQAAKANLVWSDLTYGTLVNRAITQAQAGAPADKYKLPIVIPADDVGVHSMTLYGYHMPLATDVILDIAENDAGPDVSFRPRWAADGSVEFVRTSSPYDSTNYAVYDFHVSAPDSNISGLKWNVNATDVTNRLFALGEGSEKNMLVQIATDANTPYLALERSVALKDESDWPSLRSRAVEELGASNAPTIQVSMDIPTDGSPNVSQLRLNSLIRWVVTDDPYFSAGWKEARVIEFSGNIASSKVHLEFQPLGG